MSVNLYQTGVSGLLASQQHLATTGHNIANVNTEGYNRQRAEQNTAIGTSFGSNFLGSGTSIRDVTRIYDQFSYKEQILNTSKLGAANSSEASLSQLNDVLASSGNALTSSINLFYQSINSIADNPSDSGLRSIALNQAEVIASDFQNLYENFEQLEKSHNGEIVQITNKISSISEEIAKLNGQIISQNGTKQTGQPNDLLDRRDQLVSELSEYTSVNTLTDQNGMMTVMIGSGETLVTSTTSLKVRVKSGNPDSSKTELILAGPNGKISINENLIGGSLSAKFEFRDEHLLEVKSQINRLALAFSETVNQTQSEGLDLNGVQGNNIFSDINSTQLQQARVLSPSTNTGNLQGQVSITDVSLLPTDEFQIDYDGVNYVMTNLTTLATETLVLSAPNTYSSTQGFDFIEGAGTANAGDEFIIRPAENTAALMAVTLTSGDGIAASSPVLLTPSDDNIGGGSIEISEIYDPVAARAATDLEIEILESPVGSGTFNFIVNDIGAATSSAPQAYTPPSQFVDLPLAPATAAFQIEIKGLPAGSAPFAPEKFNLNDGFGTGNGNNAQKLALTQEKNILNNSQETFVENLGVSTASVGAKAKTAELVADTAEALHTQAFNRNQATSGVNLDEEAANLIRFQQAYQASSQIISVANTLFDTLLSVAR